MMKLEEHREELEDDIDLEKMSELVQIIISSLGLSQAEERIWRAHWELQTQITIISEEEGISQAIISKFLSDTRKVLSKKLKKIDLPRKDECYIISVSTRKWLASNNKIRKRKCRSLS